MKKSMKKTMAMGMVMTILVGTTAFANETMPVSQPSEAATGATETAEASKYLTQSGKVTSIEASETEGVSVVEIENEAGGLRFAVASNTIIVDRATGAYITAAEMTEGMTVSVVYDMNSPMGMSLPPYLGNVTAVVANAAAGTVVVGKFDNELTDMKNMLKLNIGEETSIQNMQGSRIRLTEADVKGQDALVFFDASTKSIPAQTTPSFVLILSEQKAPAVSVPLRETAEANGFSVKWQGKTKPILLEKDGVSMEVMMDDATFKVNGAEAEAAFAAELKDGVMFVSNEIFE